MATVGELLRRAREEQKLDIYQVAEITKIKSDHIRALEAGNYEGFSAPVYIRGFVRSYARVLKIDISQIGEALENELGQSARFREPSPLTNEPRGAVDFLMLQLSKLNWRIAVAALAVGAVILLLVSGWRRWQGAPDTEPAKQRGSGLHQPRQPGGDFLPLPANTTPR